MHADDDWNLRDAPMSLVMAVCGLLGLAIPVLGFQNGTMPSWLLGLYCLYAVPGSFFLALIGLNGVCRSVWSARPWR